MRDSEHPELGLFYTDNNHGDFTVDGCQLSFTDLLAMDSSPSTDDDAAAEFVGAFGGESSSSPTDELTWNRYDDFTAPICTSGYFNSPAVFLSSPPISFVMPHQHNLYSSSMVTNYYDQPPTYHQLSTLDNNAKLAISETRNERRLGKPDDDGYNWRKYGQKPIKDGKFSRSYYKCTFSGCPVKKKVEHTMDGRITLIIYKSKHNHGQPQPEKRANESSSCTSSQPHEIIDSVDAYMKFEEDEEEEVAYSQGRKGGTMSNELTVTEPKIIVQTRSKIDLLDDGYRWRKYGQKVVKGNINPRSYYKCTSHGCRVRKQVERSSREPEDVVTTYDGKHDHKAPSGRNNNGSNAQQAMLHDTKTVFNSLPRLKEEKVFV